MRPPFSHGNAPAGDKGFSAKTIAASMAQRYTPLCICPFSAVRKLFKPLVGGGPQSPGKGRFAALRTLHRWSGYASLRALIDGRINRLGRSICSHRLPGRAVAPLVTMKKTAFCGSFPGFGFQYPTSVLQECIYSIRPLGFVEGVVY